MILAFTLTQLFRTGVESDTQAVTAWLVPTRGTELGCEVAVGVAGTGVGLGGTGVGVEGVGVGIAGVGVGVAVDFGVGVALGEEVAVGIGNAVSVGSAAAEVEVATAARDSTVDTGRGVTAAEVHEIPTITSNPAVSQISMEFTRVRSGLSPRRCGCMGVVSC